MPVHPSSTKHWDNTPVVPKVKAILPPRAWSLIRKADEVVVSRDSGDTENNIPVAELVDVAPITTPTWFELHQGDLSGAPVRPPVVFSTSSSASSVPRHTKRTQLNIVKCKYNPLDDEVASYPDDDSGGDNMS